MLFRSDGSWSPIVDLMISGDGSRVFGLFASHIRAWSLQTGEVVGEMGIRYESYSGSLIVDGSKVWVHWSQSNYKGWDFGISGSTPTELSNIHTPSSSNWLWDSMQASIKNPTTEEVVFQPSGRFARPVRVKCDSSHLVAGYQSGEILILDLTNVK